METTMTRTRSVVFCGLFAALVAVGAFLQVPLPNTDYFTLQTLFVILAGMLLGSARGALSIGVYVITGLLGFPVFAAGGGIGYVLRPTFGYLIGFIVAAAIIGLICEKGDEKKYSTFLTAGFTGLAVIYIIGLAYKYVLLNLFLSQPTPISVLLLAVFPLDLPGDVVLCFLGAGLALRLKPLFRRFL